MMTISTREALDHCPEALQVYCRIEDGAIVRLRLKDAAYLDNPEGRVVIMVSATLFLLALSEADKVDELEEIIREL